MNSQIKQDAQLIKTLGGPAVVARLLAYEMPHGVQRVNNWITRGIPAKVKVDRPDLFMPAILESKQPEAA